MWISVETGAGATHDVLLPTNGEWGEPGERMILRYGVQEMAVSVGLLPAEVSRAGGSGKGRSNPARVQIGRDVMETLAIRPEPTYRMKISRDRIEIGPVLGLLLGNRNHWYDHGYLNRELARVTDVYPDTGGLFCAFSPRNVSQSDRVAYGLFFHPQTGKWEFGRLPLPAVMHRRSFHNDQIRLDWLRRETGMRIFNSRRFDKWNLFQILGRDGSFRRYLPETIQVEEPDEVLKMAQRHPELILKPAGLSRGRGILCLDREGKRYRMTDFRHGQPRRTLIDRSTLKRLIAAEFCARDYLCQQRIDLARIQGAPFDVRAVMQRRQTGEWFCAGMECRLAGEGCQVTNIAFGGSALWLTDAIERSFGPSLDGEELHRRVVGIAHRICNLLDQTGEMFGEFGLDLALDRRGGIWVIEANVLPTFYGFQSLDPQLWRRLLAAPMRYASQLAGFSAEEGSLNGADVSYCGVAEPVGNGPASPGTGRQNRPDT